MQVGKEGIHQNPLARSPPIYLPDYKPCGITIHWSCGESAMHTTYWRTSPGNSCFLDGSGKYRSQGAYLSSQLSFTVHKPGNRCAKWHLFQRSYLSELNQTFSLVPKRGDLNFFWNFTRTAGGAGLILAVLI